MNTPASKRLLHGVFGLVFVCALAVMPLLAPPGGLTDRLTRSSPAAAATMDGMLSFGGYHVGAFQSSDGSRTFCLEPGVDAPLNQQLAPIRTAELPGYAIRVGDAWGWNGSVEASPVSGERLRQINWLLAEHGAIADAEHAVSVQIAIWEIRREAGTADWLDGKYELFRRYGGGPLVDAGIRLAADARHLALAPGHARPAGPLIIEQSHLFGGGRVSYPAGTTELSIQGGTFSNGATTIGLVNQEAGTVEWQAHLHEHGWARFSEVQVRGKWELPERSWPAEVILHPASRETEQRIGAGVSPVVGTHRGDFDAVTTAIDSRFTPAIKTAVPEFLVTRPDGRFADTVTVSANETGAPWPVRGADGSPLHIRADGTLFGPFAAPQQIADVPPAGAPVALRSTLQLDRGPGSYDLIAPEPPSGSGFYYWVWAIHEALQQEEVRESGLLEPNAVFADKFGVPEEGQLVPTELRWETQLQQQMLEPGSLSVEDHIRVSVVGGEWVRDQNGDRIPAVIRMTAYHLDTPPERQALPPAGARELGSVLVTVAQPDEWVGAPSFALPEGLDGWVVVRSCLLTADQPEIVRGSIAEWCDDFGVPSETARFVPPLVESGAYAEGIDSLSVLGAAAVGGGSLLLIAGGIIRMTKKASCRRREQSMRMADFWAGS